MDFMGWPSRATRCSRASPPGRTTCAFAAYAIFNRISEIGRVKGYSPVREAEKIITAAFEDSSVSCICVDHYVTTATARAMSAHGIFDALHVGLSHTGV